MTRVPKKYSLSDVSSPHYPNDSVKVTYNGSPLSQYLKTVNIFFSLHIYNYIHSFTCECRTLWSSIIFNSYLNLDIKSPWLNFIEEDNFF